MYLQLLRDYACQTISYNLLRPLTSTTLSRVSATSFYQLHLLLVSALGTFPHLRQTMPE